MPSPAPARAATPPSPAPSAGELPQRKKRNRLVVLGIAAVVFLCLAALFCEQIWPFAERPVIQNLAEASDSAVTVRGFQRTYFPFPGCVLEGITFRHGSQNRTFITIEKLTIRGSYPGILIRRIPRITAEGAHVFIPPFGSNESFRSAPSKIVVDTIVANGTVVEFESSDPRRKGLRFDVHEGLLHDVRWNSPIGYNLKLRNAEPPGELEVSGKFGAWVTQNPGETPFSGEYTFDHADLSVYGGIAGILASRGKFGGVLRRIEITGDTDTPDFEVTSAGHKVKLLTRFDAYVDATRGDTFLSRVEAHFGRTSVTASGSIAGAQGRRGKIAQLDLSAGPGRIEDILGLFVQEQRPPMSGTLAVKTKAEIPTGPEPFLQRVKLQGMFGVRKGSFSKAGTQRDVDELSAGARGDKKDDPETVLTDLEGEVALERGIAQFSDLSFTIPGAHARMNGTYNILNYKIDLHGRMRVDTQISKTETGAKALLLKMLDPVFKHKTRGEVVPVHIGGTYEHPQFGLDIAPGKQGHPQ